MRKTSGIVILPDTDQAGLVYLIWHVLHLFHSQFSIKNVPSVAHPNVDSLNTHMQWGSEQNKSPGTAEVTLNWPLVFPLPLQHRKKQENRAKVVSVAQ